MNLDIRQRMHNRAKELPMYTDFLCAWQALRAAKAYALTAMLTLGLTLGALVTVLNVTYQIVAAPLPYPAADRLYYLHGDVISANGQRTAALPIAAPEAAYALKPPAVAKIALLGYNQGIADNLADTPTLQLGYTTPEWFDMLAIPMALGRGFDQRNGLHQQGADAVLSYQSWQRWFGKDPNVLGQRLHIGSTWFRIVGVSAEHFHEPEMLFASQTTDVWLPWDYVQVPANDRQQWGRLWGKHAAVVQLQSATQADEATQAFDSDFNQHFRDDRQKPAEMANSHIDTRMTALATQVTHGASEQLAWLVLGTLLLAALGLVNLSQLVIARLSAYRPQLAIRAAIGAQPQALLTPVLLEWWLVVVGACALALLFQQFLLSAFKTLPAGLLPRLGELTLHPISAVLYLVLPLLISMLMMWRVRRALNYRQLQCQLASSSKGGARAISARQLWRFLVLQGFVVTLVLVFTVQLLWHALGQLWQPTGMELTNRYHASLNLAALDDISRPQRRSELFAIRAALEQQADISQVAIANLLPFANYGSYQWFTELQTDLAQSPSYSVASSLTDEHFLPLLATPLLSGRHFTADEVREQRPVMLVNATFAKLLQSQAGAALPPLYWANDDTHRRYQIVGVFADWHLPGMTEPPRALFATRFEGLPSLLLHSRPGAILSKTQLNAVLARINPKYQISELQTLSHNQQKLLALDLLTAVSTALVSAVTLLLSSVGLTGLLSYSAQLRRQEFGIRLAIGARPGMLIRQQLSEHLRPVLLGALLATSVLLLMWQGWRLANGSLALSIAGFVIPLLLVVIVTTATSLNAVRRLLYQPAIQTLRGA